MKVYQAYLYKISKEHYPNLIKMAKYFIARNKNEYDNQVAIEGSTGSGKSMFTFVLILISYHMLGKTFNVRNQVMFIPTENQLRNAIPKLNHCDHYWIDEAIRALDKHFWYRLEQIELNQLVKTDTRRMELSMLYNIQRFRELTESFRNHNIQTRIFVIMRTYAVMYIRDDDKDIEDPWHTKENIKKKSSWKELSGGGGYYKYSVAKTPEEILSREKKCIGYEMHTNFPDLSSIPGLTELWDYYKLLKDESREKAEADRQANKDSPKTTYEKKYNRGMMGLMKKSYKEGLTCDNWYQENKKFVNLGRATVYKMWSVMISEDENNNR